MSNTIISTDAFDEISVNIATGAISYPEVKGFTLDKEHVYRSAARFINFCNGSVETAVKFAIHEQISAFRGLQSLRPVVR